MTDIQQAIRRVACERCGREPTEQSDETLSAKGRCIVCRNWFNERLREGHEWAVYRWRSLRSGTWHDEDEVPSDGRQATLTET